METPALRAERLLRQVLGESRFLELRRRGYLDLPSQRFPGRMYRLDGLGNLSYREPGEESFGTVLCIQPQEPLPRDDVVAMRYLLATADEERLTRVANPITFGLVSLLRAVHHDFREYLPGWLAALSTLGLTLFFLGTLYLEITLVLRLLAAPSLLLATGCFLLSVFALVGLLLVVAAAADLWRAARIRFARGRLRA